MTSAAPVPAEVTPPIAGFWRRFGAFLLDGLLLGLTGAVAGLVLSDVFAGLGAWGRLLGFVVALGYFGTMNSRLWGGQTLGKRVLKLKVVDKGGALLSPAIACWRFVPLGAAWFLNNATLPEAAGRGAWPYVLTFSVFGLGFSILYLAVFNRQTLQSLHDLLVGSYVVHSAATGPVTAPAVWRGHLLACALLMTAATLVPVFGQKIIADPKYASLLKTQQAVLAEPWVSTATVNRGQTVFKSFVSGQSTTTTYYAIVAYSRDGDIANTERAKALAKIALANEPEGAKSELLQITLVSGYDIGIASNWRSNIFRFEAGKWGNP